MHHVHAHVIHQPYQVKAGELSAKYKLDKAAYAEGKSPSTAAPKVHSALEESEDEDDTETESEVRVGQL